MPVERFKVVIENDEHCQAVCRELERLGAGLFKYHVKEGSRPTCITMWDSGRFSIWSLPVSASNYMYHTKTYRLADLAKMQTLPQSEYAL